VPELSEEFEEFEEFESEELDELVPELLAGVGVVFALDEPAVAELDEFDVLLSDELLVTAACVEPGSTATTTPAATTEANETVIVVAFRRRLPCSRSATACASLRAAA
jgi:hypothetical protein